MKEPSRFSAWILPVHDTIVYGTGHWTALIVKVQKKLIVYLDSPQGTLPGPWIQKLCGSINHTHDVQQNWLEWTIHVPTDIPEQGNVPGTSANCGPHMCV